MEPYRIRDFFRLTTSENKLAASVDALSPPEDASWSTEEWMAFLEEEGITYGILNNNIERLSSDPLSVVYPLEVARGTESVNGAAAYIEPGNFEESDEPEDTDEVDLKKVIQIAMVEAGAYTGRKIDAEPGESGTGVDGRVLQGRDGNDFVLRAGKNTRLEGNDIYAVQAGQVSVGKKTIHVNPLYEVKGDIDLKTGNIDFTGNIMIRGNVPSGFELKAEGDIRVLGTVEAAVLEASGSIFINAGVNARNKGRINAGQNVHATYLNEADVSAGADIVVKQTIMHSRCTTGGTLICNQGRGQVVGGVISAVQEINVNEAGNTMNTPTSFYIGATRDYVERRKHLEQTLYEAKEESLKVTDLLKTIQTKEENGSSLSSKERVMKLRARNTLEAAKDKARHAAEELEELAYVSPNPESGIIKAAKTLHSNVDVHFGKYRRIINKSYDRVVVYLEEGEITLNVT
ncbi:DUF342 domain-containing protein [Salibacterium halotolerans]|uniref:Flagellar Assembly Protein A N-terminal region domain-containing protein n=1 Tax=Salibacterium halotolerans TaxID=1884432 RepID=A0A1I5MH56_9BACI|nr:FapA family protein [Salibacterium halotolerans]SFP08276.1 hypothetical protein SAMN05518683_102216 [Salibacterium halotolerans]